MTTRCSDEFCGPFYFSKAYWSDAGSITISGDSPASPKAYQNCAKDYTCAGSTVTNYMKRYATDCNNDGVVDCLDYAYIHMQGPAGCSSGILSSTSFGKLFLQRYNTCRTEDDFLNQLDVRNSFNTRQ